MEMPEGFKKFTDKYVTFPPIPEVDNELKAAFFLQEMAKAIEFDLYSEDSGEGFVRLATVLQEFKEWK
jgi:hypothetical protein